MLDQEGSFVYGRKVFLVGVFVVALILLANRKPKGQWVVQSPPPPARPDQGHYYCSFCDTIWNLPTTAPFAYCPRCTSQSTDLEAQYNAS